MLLSGTVGRRPDPQVTPIRNDGGRAGRSRVFNSAIKADSACSPMVIIALGARRIEQAGGDVAAALPDVGYGDPGAVSGAEVESLLDR